MVDRVKTEHEEQREFVSWFRREYPGVIILAIPNGGRRSKSEALKLKAEGVIPGIPDLFIPEWGLWIEMKKTVGGRLSDQQRDIGNYLQICGYRWFVCKGANEAISLARRIYTESWR